MDVAEHNVAEIAALRSWRLRVNLIFFGSLVAIPLGVFCPCAAALVVHHFFTPGSGQLVALSALLLPLVGVAGTLLMIGDRRRSRRALDLARFADERGLAYTHRPPPQWAEFLEPFPFTNLLRQEHSGLGKNLMQGAYKGRPVTAVDFSFNYVLANRLAHSEQTVVVFTEGFAALPDFAVVPRSLADPVEDLILGSPLGETIRLHDEPDFNRAFAVVGSDRKRVREVLTSDLVEVLLDDPDIVLEVAGSMVMVYRRDVVLPAREYEDLLLHGGRIARQLAPRADS